MIINKLLVGLFLLVSAGLMMTNQHYLLPALQAQSQELADVSATLVGKRKALADFQEQISKTEEGTTTRLTFLEDSPEKFFAAFDAKIKTLAASAGVYIELIEKQTKILGTSRTKGLLAMPRNAADEYFFVVRGRGKFDRWISFLTAMKNMPWAVSNIQITKNEWALGIVLWRIK